MTSPGTASEQPPQSGYSIDFDATRRVLRVSGFGVITIELMNDADTAVRQFVADEGANFEIIDFSAVTEFRVTASEVRSFAQMPPTSPPFKLRVSVAPATVVYGMNRMYDLLIAGRRSDFQVVRTRKEAEALIGLGTLDFSRRLLEKLFQT